MNERLSLLRERAICHDYAQYRRELPTSVVKELEQDELSWVQRAARVTHLVCAAEVPVIAPEERIVFTRTVKNIPGIPVPATVQAELDAEKKWLYPINNISADWGMALSEGLLGRRAAALRTREALKDDAEAVEFLDGAIETIDAVLDLAARYADAAEAMGRDDVAAILRHVPAHRPRTFHEALQSLRICQAVLWLSGHMHVGLGRLDQYLWPYLQDDLDSGRLTVEMAEELLAEFFISLNRDTELYPGVQQGDNGQSLMLGGVTRDGVSAVNPLTWMALRVARDTALIDPKINLRVNGETDLDLLCLATELTRKGLGFPQYCNDDVVIPAMVNHGYTLEDARDYTVAACWEVIIPGKGLEVVNIGALSFPAAADRGIREGLAAGDTFDGILTRVRDDIDTQVRKLVEHHSRLVMVPAPYYSVLMDGCLERGRDMAHGMRYSNCGVHGACSSSAADALAAVRELIFRQQRITPQELLQALEDNYAHQEPLRQMLIHEAPKVGNHDDDVDDLLTMLFDAFAGTCARITDNGRGGGVRPGTGSAMFYLWLATGEHGGMEPVVGATAEGRRRGEAFSASLAPAPGVSVRGPISVLQTFSKIDYSRIYNGGPITMEFSDAVFRDEEAIIKVAMLVRTFARLGCQELQLNTVNYETLLDAKAHPERHRNLIVRVWGWSGYFCELAPAYQDHIIARNRYLMAAS